MPQSEDRRKPLDNQPLDDLDAPETYDALRPRAAMPGVAQRDPLADLRDCSSGVTEEQMQRIHDRIDEEEAHDALEEENENLRAALTDIIFITRITGAALGEAATTAGGASQKPDELYWLALQNLASASLAACALAERAGRLEGE